MISVMGITGTRTGPTKFQIENLTQLFNEGDTCPLTVIHGGAVGVDDFADQLAMQANCHRIIFPANSKECDDEQVVQYERQVHPGAVVMRPLPPLERNSLIAYNCDLLVGVPRLNEVEQRSGTWATIRDGWRFKRPTLILYPAPFFPENRPPHESDSLWMRYNTEGPVAGTMRIYVGKDANR